MAQGWLSPSLGPASAMFRALMKFLSAALLPLGVQAFCGSRESLPTEGYWFKFSLDFKFTRLNPEGGTHILQSENEAFGFYVHSMETNNHHRLRFKLYTVLGVGSEGTGGGNVLHLTRLEEGVWYHVLVSKTTTKTCVIVDGSQRCANKQTGVNQIKFQMKQPGAISIGAESNFTGLEVKNWKTESALDHYSYTEAYDTSYVTYYLVSVNSGKPANNNDPLRDPFADTSDPALGHYVKPRWGTFQRLRMECGYKLSGNLAFIETKGTWTWEMPLGYLTTVGTPVKVAGNSSRDPNLPGLVGPHAQSNKPWNDRGSGWSYPTFGTGSWYHVDKRRWIIYAHACEPQAETNRRTWTNWQDSPYGAADSKYIRLWLGVEYVNLTTTTTFVCTTTTTTLPVSATGTTVSESTTSLSTTGTGTATETTSTPFTTTSTVTTVATATETTSTLTTGTATSFTTSSVSSTSTSSRTITGTTTTVTDTTVTTTTVTSTVTTSSTLTETSSTSSTLTSTVSSTSTATATETTSTATTGTSVTESSSTSSSTSSLTSSSTSSVSSSSSTSETSTSHTGTSTTSVTTTTSSSTSSSSSSSSSTTTISSSTTSTSSSSMTSSTSSTTTFGSADEVLGWLSGQETALLSDLLGGGAKRKVLQVPGATIAAARLEAAPGAETVGIAVDGTDAAVGVPAAMLKNPRFAGAVGVVTVFDSTLSSTVGPVKAALNMNLFNSSGGRIAVDDTEEPFVITLPVNRSENQSCSYWDELLQSWSSRGLWEVPPKAGDEKGLMVCAAKHLTLFGALIQGFLTALMCAQVNLLTPEAMREIFRGDWWSHPVSMLFWLLNFVLALLFALAFARDRKRLGEGGWDDECFLIPLHPGPPEAEERALEDAGNLAAEEQPAEAVERRVRVVEPSAEEESSEEGGAGEGSDELGPAMSARPSMSVKMVHSAKKARQSTLAAFWHAFTVVTAPCVWCMGISAVQDAVDDIFSRWFSYFGQIRSFCEGVCHGLRVAHEEGDPRSTCARISSAVVSALIASSVRRQVSASMALSEDIVSFITDDEDLGNMLLEAALLSGKVDSEGQSVTKWERHLFQWHKLHAAVLEEFDRHWHETSWRRLPLSAWRLLVAGVPFTNVFFDCRFTPSGLRMLLFTSELYGNFLVATIFYQASGTVSDKNQTDPACLEEPEGLAAELGRILAIAIASVFIASLPVAILGSLHARGFKKLPYDGCPEWERQLRVWRVQDRVIWVLGGCYNLFCILFVMSFLANVASTEIPAWGAMGGLTLAEDCLIIPFAIAFLVPLFAALALSSMSGFTGRRRKQLLEQKRAELEAGPGNWRQTVLAI